MKSLRQKWGNSKAAWLSFILISLVGIVVGFQNCRQPELDSLGNNDNKDLGYKSLETLSTVENLDSMLLGLKQEDQEEQRISPENLHFVFIDFVQSQIQFGVGSLDSPGSESSLLPMEPEVASLLRKKLAELKVCTPETSENRVSCLAFTYPLLHVKEKSNATAWKSMAVNPLCSQVKLCNESTDQLVDHLLEVGVPETILNDSLGLQ